VSSEYSQNLKDPRLSTGVSLSYTGLEFNVKSGDEFVC